MPLSPRQRQQVRSVIEPYLDDVSAEDIISLIALFKGESVSKKFETLSTLFNHPGLIGNLINSEHEQNRPTHNEVRKVMFEYVSRQVIKITASEEWDPVSLSTHINDRVDAAWPVNRLGAGQKELIQSAIAHYCPMKEDGCTNEEMGEAISGMTRALSTKLPETDDMHCLSDLFYEPSTLYRITDIGGAVTNGEVREYIIVYLNQCVNKLVQETGCQENSHLWKVTELLEHARSLDDSLAIVSKVEAPPAEFDPAAFDSDDSDSEENERQVEHQDLTYIQSWQNRLNIQRLILAGIIQNREVTDLIREEFRAPNQRYAILDIVSRSWCADLMLSNPPGLTVEELTDLSLHQLKALEYGITVGQAKTINDHQYDGLCLGLTYDQVMVPHFASLTVVFLRMARERNEQLDVAYNLIARLQEDQIIGISIGLTRDQVLSDGYLPHTSRCITLIVRGGTPQMTQQCFETIKGLTIIQCEAIISFGLTRDQALSFTDNMYIHLFAKLTRRAGLSKDMALEQIHELSPLQAECMYKKDFTREQVIDKHLKDEHLKQLLEGEDYDTVLSRAKEGSRSHASTIIARRLNHNQNRDLGSC
ncbi:MAG: hypothetical protein IPP74_09390 [Alphaproteobacteria bacterium]|nr:hypothetical protein [Alphaproteobacteria bacterium]